MITVRIRFEKTGEAAYISLLDLQRVFHRILKRSGLPVYYTRALTRISIFPLRARCLWGRKACVSAAR